MRGSKPEDESPMSRDRVDEALERIASALRGLRFGTVTAVVQDGVVVQVERTERVRLIAPSRARLGTRKDRA